MINLFAISFIVLLLTGTGWNLSRAFSIGNKIERMGLSFFLGSGVSTFLWFILYRIGFPFTFGSLILACCLVSLVGMFFDKIKTPRQLNPVKLSKLDWALILIIILGILASFIIGTYYPITAWDSMALYDSRAHMITLNHSLKDIVDSSYYLSYPLFLSLLHTAVYLLGGSNPQSLQTIIFAAFLAVIYGRLSSWTNHRLALIGTFLNLFIYELLYHSTIAYANLSYTAFLTLAFLYGVSKDKLILSGLLLGLSTWVRSTEVFWILGLILIANQGYRSQLYKHALAAFLIFLTIRQGWLWYYQTLIGSLAIPPLTPAPIFSQASINQIIVNIPEIWDYLNRYALTPYLGFWGMALGSIILSFRTGLPKAKALSLIAFATLIMTAVGTAIYSTFFPTWYAIGDSVHRMLMFLSPLIMTTTMITIHSILPRRYVK